MVVRTDTNLDTGGEKGTSWVRAHIVLVAEDLVGDGAALNTDVLVLHLLDEARMHLQSEAVTNALGAKQDGVVELSVGPLVRLASVEIELESVTKLHLHFEDLLEEIVDRRIVVLLVDHIEAGDKIRDLIRFNDSIELRLNVVLAEHLEATDDEAHTEQRVTRLD